MQHHQHAGCGDAEANRQAIGVVEMKRDIGKEILTGLEEIAAWKRGEKKLRTTEVAMPTAADVKAIRDSLELSQESFAGFLGVSLGTVRNWEQKRREPQGPARALLLVAAKQPRAVRAAFNSMRSDRGGTTQGARTVARTKSKAAA
jgi:putative transcriptional regulator